MTYRIFASILSGSCALASFIIVSALVLQYPRHYSNPIQQRQIIWILFLIPWVALFSFLIVWKRDAGECLIGSLDFGCATALSSFLLLLCDYIFGHPDGVDELFSDWALKNGQSVTHSPKWLKVRYSVIPNFLLLLLKMHDCMAYYCDFRSCGNVLRTVSKSPLCTHPDCDTQGSYYNNLFNRGPQVLWSYETQTTAIRHVVEVYCPNSNSFY